MKDCEYDIIYGLHSNIPACCIVFYLTEWTEDYEHDRPYSRAVHMDNLNYVPCPECFALRRHNVLKICERDCRKKCYQEFAQRGLTPLEAQTVQAMSYHINEWRASQ